MKLAIIIRLQSFIVFLDIWEIKFLILFFFCQERGYETNHTLGNIVACNS